MFTGIIVTTGKIEDIQPKHGDIRLQVESQQLELTDIVLGDSIAVNGVCLTVVKMDSRTLSFDVSRKSLERTSLGDLTISSKVNLEKALTIGDKLGGHYVSGHVDGLGGVISMIKSARSMKYFFAIPTELGCYIAVNGSICVDGVSLTVNDIGDSWCEVNIIPNTMQTTIISTYQVGTKVNIEIDLIARYLERLLLTPI